MKEETPKDITPIKRKGIDIAVNGLKKLYPFVKGYQDDESVDQYESSHYIDLIIDNDKLSEYMDAPVNPYWKNFIETNPQHSKVYAVWSYLKFDDDMLDDIGSHPGYKLMDEIKTNLDDLYSYLPDEYKLQYPSRSGWIDPPPMYDVHLKINGYLMT
jgi:hypothetical protein